MTKKTYNFEIISSKHHGRLVEYTFKDESCEDEYFKNDNSFEIELTMPPENNYIVYVINEFPNWCIEDKWTLDTLDDAEYTTTLFHELTHMEQRLRCKHQYRVGWKDYSKWKGKKVNEDIPYALLPWEIEANQQEEKLTTEYISSLL